MSRWLSSNYLVLSISNEPWAIMARHAIAAYPRECCGILLGTVSADDRREVTRAIACRNAYEGEQADHFELDPKEQFDAQREARRLGVEVIGFFHSHPDCDAYFSATDLAHSWPWYSNVVISVRDGAVCDARSFRANDTQTESTSEELICPKS